MMAAFKKGDRVVCVRQSPGWVNPLIGATGTVLEYDRANCRVHVAWDEELPIGGHTCDGRCEDNHGWIVPDRDVARLCECPDLGEIPDALGDNLESLLFGVKS